MGKSDGIVLFYRVRMGEKSRRIRICLNGGVYFLGFGLGLVVAAAAFLGAGLGLGLPVQCLLCRGAGLGLGFAGAVVFFAAGAGLGLGFAGAVVFLAAGAWLGSRCRLLWRGLRF